MQFTCPQCVAVLTAPASAAGKRCRCPRCHYVFVAPEHSRLPVPGETYALHEGEPAEALPDIQIPVFCSVCHTRMLGGLDQIGQTLICPDCGTPAIVPSPSSEVRHLDRRAADDIYAVSKEVDAAVIQPVPDEKNLIRVRCPRCDTIMYATENQVGSSLTCPDCSTSVVVPKPSLHRPTIDVMADADEGYAIADWAPSREPPPIPPPLPPTVRRAGDSMKSACVFEPYIRHRVLPRWPFVSGIFNFPFFTATQPYFALFGGWTALAMWMYVQSIMLVEHGDARSVYAGAILGALTLMTSLMLLAYATSSALAIVRDSSEGCDQVSSWPNLAFIDWIGETFYVIIAFCFGVIAGMGVDWVLMQCDASDDSAKYVAMFLLFPFGLLSSIETGSPLGLFSWPVFCTLWRAWLGWIRFYIETGVLLAVAAFLAILGLSADPFWGILVAAPAFSYAWFVYFRLLGRLAFYCADVARKRDEPAVE